MGCRSDYLQQTDYEQRLQETAQLLVYVKNELGLKVGAELTNAAADYYCKADYVPELCNALRDMTAAQVAAVVFNARSKQSRQLADWWEEHQEADRARKAEEAKTRKDNALRKKALAKLTPAERKALGL